MHMEIYVRLYGSLRDLAGGNGRVTLTLPAGATLADLKAELGVTRPVIIACNDQHETADNHVLQDGDRVALFSVMGGGTGALTTEET